MRISCKLSHVGLFQNLYPELSEIIERIVASLEVRNVPAANSFINPRYTISSVFRDLLIPFKLRTKIPKSKKLFLPCIFVIGDARREERSANFYLNKPIMCLFFVHRENQ